MTKGERTVQSQAAKSRARGGGAKKRPDAATTSDHEMSALRAWLAERNVRKAKVGGIDIDGVWRGKYISIDKLLSSVSGGLGFCDVVFGWDMGDALYDNAQVTGWHTGYPDTLATIDLSTRRIIPWEPDTAAFLLDFKNADGTPFEPSPRQLLQKIHRRALDMGFRPKFGSEYEYFIFRETPQSAQAKHYVNLEPLTPGMFGYSWLRTSENAELVHAIVDGCNAFGIEVEGMHTETGPGVYETAILYDDLDKAADKSAMFKTAVKEICARHGLIATFMAKPSAKLPGCSGHVHQSLWDLDGERNAFFDPRDGQHMSRTFRHYLGGQVQLMPEFTAFYWPTINSYKRSVENTWAPTTATWGIENRTSAIRVIGASPKSIRLEYRQLGADMNPYIGMAASLAAGLWGIANRIEPTKPCEGNGYASRAKPLPRSLRAAVEALDRSKLARQILGDGFVDHYLRTREWEVRQYERAVTNWELERYLELV